MDGIQKLKKDLYKKADGGKVWVTIVTGNLRDLE